MQGSLAQVFRKFELLWISNDPAPTSRRPMRTDIGGNDHLHEICPQEVSIFGYEAWHKDCMIHVHVTCVFFYFDFYSAFFFMESVAMSKLNSACQISS